MKKIKSYKLFGIGCLITVGVTYIRYQYLKRIKNQVIIEEYEEKLVG